MRSQEPKMGLPQTKMKWGRWSLGGGNECRMRGVEISLSTPLLGLGLCNWAVSRRFRKAFAKACLSLLDW